MTIDLILGVHRLFGKYGVAMSNTKRSIIGELKDILQQESYAYSTEKSYCD